MAAFSIPAEVSRRMQTRVNRAGADLFALLDEVQEHGGTYVSLIIERPGMNGEPRRMRVILASPTVEVTSVSSNQVEAS